MARPALDRLLNAPDLINMPPSLTGGGGFGGDIGFGCDGCPFATLSAGQTEAEIAHDRSEAYFDCSLLDRPRVWGEEPACRIADWQRRAREEMVELEPPRRKDWLMVDPNAPVLVEREGLRLEIARAGRSRWTVEIDGTAKLAFAEPPRFALEERDHGNAQSPRDR